MKKQANLAKDAIVPLFFKYYIPAFTGLLSITINQVIDGLILGKYVGKTGVAAVGLFGPVITVLIAFLLIFVIGGGIQISKCIGGKNYVLAQQVFLFISTWTLLLGAVIMLSIPIGPKYLAEALAGSENTILYQHTYDYLFWAFLWIPFFFIRVLWGSVINHDNAPKISRNASLIAVVFNIIFNVVLVIFLDMGVEGASIATGIAVLVSVGYLLHYLLKEKGHLKIRQFSLILVFKEWKELLHHGFPTFISEISFSAGLLLINTKLVTYGSDAVSTFGILIFISFIFLRFFTSAMVSALPIMSFNIGAKLGNRVLETLKVSVMISFVMGVITVAVGFLFGSQLILPFSDSQNLEFVDSAPHALGLFFIFFLAAGPNYILGAYLQAIGKSRLCIVLNALKGLVLIWVFLELIPFFELGLDGIWLSRSFSEIFALLLVGLFTFLQRRKYYSIAAIIKE